MSEMRNAMYAQAYHDLGMTKEAGLRSAFMAAAPKATALGRAMLRSGRDKFVGGAKAMLPTRKGLREFAIGDPKRFIQELRSGTALGKGSLIRESMHAPDMMSKAMFYGLPAVEAGGIILDDEGNKGRRLAGSIGGAALGLAAWKPLGMAGSIGADILGRRVGESIGGVADRLARKNPEANVDPNGPPKPLEGPPSVTMRMAGRALGALNNSGAQG